MPGIVRKEKKGGKKIKKNRDLCRKIRKLGKVSCKIVPIVVGCQITLLIRLPLFISSLGMKLSVETIQKAAILGSARILKMVLETKMFSK